MDEPKYFQYLNKPKRKKNFRKFFAVILVIIAAIGLGVLLFWGIFKMEGKDMPWKGLFSKPEKTLVPTPLPEPTPQPTKTPEPTPAPTPVPTGIIVNQEMALSDEILGKLKEDIRAPEKVKGIYVTGPKAGSEGMDSLIELVDETELNAMVIDIKNDSGEITYKMDLDSVKELGASVGYIRDIEGLVKKLKEKDIYLIARVVAFKDPILAEKRKELCIRTKDGEVFRDSKGLAWVNPYNREVWDYIIEVSKEAVKLGFDEIQFDYIRFDTGMKDVDFGEDTEKYTKEEIINGFTKYAYEQLMPLGVYVSADVFGAIINSETDAGIVGQNYPQMSRSLDYICPMIYPSHYANGVYGIEYPDTEPYNLILKALEDSKGKLAADKTPHQAVVRPWLQDFTATWVEHHIVYDKKALRDQIKAVYDAGYEEWIFWSGASRYTEDAFLKE